jgi:response regulator RpfG family c-di-GMP phosphodiesterase
MSLYIVRVRPGRFGADTLLGANNSRQLAREIVKAYDCKLTHFQPASRRYPMTLVCEAEDNQKIAKVMRGLDVFGYVEAEMAKLPEIQRRLNRFSANSIELRVNRFFKV